MSNGVIASGGDTDEFGRLEHETLLNGQVLDTLELSSRTAAMLKKTLEDPECVEYGDTLSMRELVQMSEAEFLRIPRMGRKSFNEFKELLAFKGLHFGTPPDSLPPLRHMQAGPVSKDLVFKVKGPDAAAVQKYLNRSAAGERSDLAPVLIVELGKSFYLGHKTVAKALIGDGKVTLSVSAGFELQYDLKTGGGELRLAHITNYHPE